MHLLLPALIRLFKVDASVDMRRAALKTLMRLIPRVQVSNKFLLVNKFGRNYCINLFVLYFKLSTNSVNGFSYPFFSFPSGYWSHFFSRASLEASLGRVSFTFSGILS